MAAQFAQMGEISFSNAPDGLEVMQQRLGDILELEESMAHH